MRSDKINYIYIVQCADGTLYTGYTNDLESRMAAHNSGAGAKYTRGRGPIRLLYSEAFATKGEALKRENQIKKLSRDRKLKLAGIGGGEMSWKKTNQGKSKRESMT